MNMRNTKITDGYTTAIAAAQDAASKPTTTLTRDEKRVAKQLGISDEQLALGKRNAERENTEGLTADEVRVAKQLGVSLDALRASKTEAAE
jgi:phage I-like protein